MTKEEYIERYRKMCNAYLKDGHWETKLSKHDQMREMEFVLSKVFKVSKTAIDEIYTGEYWKIHSPTL